MKYRKWILDKKEIEKRWKELKKEMHPQILSIPDESLRIKLGDIYKFIQINFEEDLKEGIETRKIRNSLFRYAQNCYFCETNGVEEMIHLLDRKKIFHLYDDKVVESFIKQDK